MSEWVQIIKWLFFTISSFAIVEEMASSSFNFTKMQVNCCAVAGSPADVTSRNMLHFTQGTSLLLYNFLSCYRRTSLTYFPC